MTFSSLWARITGADKKQQYPNQQVSALGRLGDQTIVFPYCLYVDLPNDALLKEIAPGVFVPVTIDRPSDSERGEPIFFHPGTNTRIIPRNNGDLDIDTVDESGNVNISTVKANITASDSINMTAPLTKVAGDFEVTGTSTLKAVTSNGKDISDVHGHPQGVDSNGDTQQNTGGVL